MSAGPAAGQYSRPGLVRRCRRIRWSSATVRTPHAAARPPVPVADQGDDQDQTGDSREDHHHAEDQDSGRRGHLVPPAHRETRSSMTSSGMGARGVWLRSAITSRAHMRTGACRTIA